nr:hypothetical protein HK105_005972 [Polyrhizophydium stewartii]
MLRILAMWAAARILAPRHAARLVAWAARLLAAPAPPTSAVCAAAVHCVACIAKSAGAGFARICAPVAPAALARAAIGFAFAQRIDALPESHSTHLPLLLFRLLDLVSLLADSDRDARARLSEYPCMRSLSRILDSAVGRLIALGWPRTLSAFDRVSTTLDLIRAVCQCLILGGRIRLGRMPGPDPDSAPAARPLAGFSLNTRRVAATDLGAIAMAPPQPLHDSDPTAKALAAKLGPQPVAGLQASDPPAPQINELDFTVFTCVAYTLIFLTSVPLKGGLITPASKAVQAQLARPSLLSALSEAMPYEAALAMVLDGTFSKEDDISLPPGFAKAVLSVPLLIQSPLYPKRHQHVKRASLLYKYLRLACLLSRSEAFMGQIVRLERPVCAAFAQFTGGLLRDSVINEQKHAGEKDAERMADAARQLLGRLLDYSHTRSAFADVGILESLVSLQYVRMLLSEPTQTQVRAFRSLLVHITSVSSDSAIRFKMKTGALSIVVPPPVAHSGEKKPPAPAHSGDAAANPAIPPSHDGIIAFMACVIVGTSTRLMALRDDIPAPAAAKYVAKKMPQHTCDMMQESLDYAIRFLTQHFGHDRGVAAALSRRRLLDWLPAHAIEQAGLTILDNIQSLSLVHSLLDLTLVPFEKASQAQNTANPDLLDLELEPDIAPDVAQGGYSTQPDAAQASPDSADKSVPAITMTPATPRAAAHLLEALFRSSEMLTGLVCQPDTLERFVRAMIEAPDPKVHQTLFGIVRRVFVSQELAQCMINELGYSIIVDTVMQYLSHPRFGERAKSLLDNVFRTSPAEQRRMQHIGDAWTKTWGRDAAQTLAPHVQAEIDGVLAIALRVMRFAEPTAARSRHSRLLRDRAALAVCLLGSDRLLGIYNPLSIIASSSSLGRAVPVSLASAAASMPSGDSSAAASETVYISPDAAARILRSMFAAAYHDPMSLDALDGDFEECSTLGESDDEEPAEMSADSMDVDAVRDESTARGQHAGSAQGTDADAESTRSNAASGDPPPPPLWAAASRDTDSGDMDLFDDGLNDAFEEELNGPFENLSDRPSYQHTDGGSQDEYGWIPGQDEIVVKVMTKAEREEQLMRMRAAVQERQRSSLQFLSWRFRRNTKRKTLHELGLELPRQLLAVLSPEHEWRYHGESGDPRKVTLVADAEGSGGSDGSVEELTVDRTLFERISPAFDAMINSRYHEHSTRRVRMAGTTRRDWMTIVEYHMELDATLHVREEPVPSADASADEVGVPAALQLGDMADELDHIVSVHACANQFLMEHLRRACTQWMTLACWYAARNRDWPMALRLHWWYARSAALNEYHPSEDALPFDFGVDNVPEDAEERAIAAAVERRNLLLAQEIRRQRELEAHRLMMECFEQQSLSALMWALSLD